MISTTHVSSFTCFSKFSSLNRTGGLLFLTGRPSRTGSGFTSLALSLSSSTGSAVGRSCPVGTDSLVDCPSTVGGITSTSGGEFVAVTLSGVGVEVSVLKSSVTFLKNVTCLVIVLVSPRATTRLPFRL